MRPSKSKLSIYMSCAGLFTGVLMCASLAFGQGGPDMRGPTGGPKVNPPIVLLPSTPPIGGPGVLPPPSTNPPPVPKGVREALQGQVVREVGPRRRTFASRCALQKAGEFRSFATIQGNLREEINSKLTITGTCFGTQRPAIGGLMVRLQRGDAAPERFFRPLPEFGNADLYVQSWTPNKIELTVPQLINDASLPLALGDLLTFVLFTNDGPSHRVILTKGDVDKFQRDGILTFTPSP
jgi:hypothetical protein